MYWGAHRIKAKAEGMAWKWTEIKASLRIKQENECKNKPIFKNLTSIEYGLFLLFHYNSFLNSLILRGNKVALRSI